MSEIKVATLNLFNRMGDWERRAPLVLAQLEALGPDVIGFQEVDLDIDQGMWISRQINKRLGDSPHYRIKHGASPGKYASVHGIGTLSRLAVVEHEVVDLMTYDRIAQRLVLEQNSVRFAFVNTHLHHPPEAIQERVDQIEYLLSWLDRHSPKLPTVVSGDFNSYTGERGVALMKSHYRSAYETIHGSEPDRTWPTPVNTFDDSPHGTLDYIYVSEEFKIHDSGLAFDESAEDDSALFPSDHLGIYARLEL